MAEPSSVTVTEVVRRHEALPEPFSPTRGYGMIHNVHFLLRRYPDHAPLILVTLTVLSLSALGLLLT